MKSLRTTLNAGFTLVEMLVVAPIIILAIGAFIALIVNLTGEVMSSRGANMLTYNLQDALNRIEEDVKLSAGYLATNSIPFGSTNPQGRGGVNSTTNFILTDPTHGTALILNSYATNGNPVSINSGLIYLADKPNDCSDYAAYSKNRPMTTNIVYFIDGDGTLWRRVIMPLDYDNPATYCGSSVPWQRPTCIDNPARHSFCKTNDEKLLEHVGTDGFHVDYYTAASNSVPVTITGATTTADLQSATTVSIALRATDTIAGREISKAGTLRVSRLDTNASAVGDLHAPTGAPASPALASSVTDGHIVTYTWPQVATATSYSVRYRVNSGAWSTATTLTNTNRSYAIHSGWNGDTVEMQITAHNDAGSSATVARSTAIPLYAPSVLQNNWNNYSPDFATAAFTKTSEGVVVLRGLVKRAGSAVGGETIFQLPEDYRPSAPIMFTTMTDPNTASRIDIQPNGNVIISSGSGGWIAFDGIRFIPTSTSSITFQPLTMVNGWVNYDTNWTAASYAKDSLNRTFTRGLIRSGSTTAASLIGALPAGFSSPSYLHIPTYTGSGFGLFSPSQVNSTYSAGAGLQYKTGSNGYLSIESMFYNDYTGWTSLPLQNGWVWYSSAGIFSTPAYIKAADGIVSLKGLIMSGTTTAGTTIATLPAGYRPSSRLIFEVVNNSAASRVDVYPTGQVIIQTGGNVWLALDNISFVAEQ